MSAVGGRFKGMAYLTIYFLNPDHLPMIPKVRAEKSAAKIVPVGILTRPRAPLHRNFQDSWSLWPSSRMTGSMSPPDRGRISPTHKKDPRVQVRVRVHATNMKCPRINHQVHLIEAACPSFRQGRCRPRQERALPSIYHWKKSEFRNLTSHYRILRHISLVWLWWGVCRSTDGFRSDCLTRAPLITALWFITVECCEVILLTLVTAPPVRWLI